MITKTVFLIISVVITILIVKLSIYYNSGELMAVALIACIVSLSILYCLCEAIDSDIKAKRQSRSLIKDINKLN